MNHRIRALVAAIPRKYQKAAGAALALVIVGAVAVIGTGIMRYSNAATGGTQYLSPASTSVASGANVTFVLHETSGTNPVNAVQSSITYDATKLQYLSITEGTAFSNKAATDTATAGLIRVARGTPASTTVTGDQTVLSVTFKVLATSGSATVGIDKSFSNIALAADGTDMLTTVTGATVTVATPSGSLSLSPATGTYAPGSTIGVALREDSGTIPVNAVQAHITYDATKLQYVSITEGPIYPNVAATDTATAGIVRVARGTAGTAVTGSNPVLTVNFKVLGGGGTSTALAFNTSFSFIARASDNTNVLTSATGATYQIVQAGPTVTSVTPTSGSMTGGTVMTINGTNFVSGATVKVGGTVATGVTFVSSTQLRVTTPAHAAGSVDVAVTNPDATTGSLASAFTYISSAPTISAITPSSGTATGGTILTITGTSFASGAIVKIGGTTATGVTITSATSIRATAPAHAAGTVDVTVTNPDSQVATKTAGYAYLALGDANNDGRVNAIDLSILISHDGQNYAPADFNADGTVGSADLAILLGRWTW